MDFEIVGTIKQVRTIAVGRAIHDLRRLRRAHGSALWRKRKGVAIVRLADDTIRRAEIHWYEAHGLGRKEIKIKRWLQV